MTKTCSSCNQAKALSDYHRHPRSRDGLAYACKLCAAARNKAWRVKNADRLREYERLRLQRPERREANRVYSQRRYRVRVESDPGAVALQSFTAVLKKYGLTPADYERMFEEQKGRCAICQRDSAENSRRMHVDHDHSTGHVRGLLCGRCNVGIGALGDDAGRLVAAAAYLIASEDAVQEVDA